MPIATSATHPIRVDFVANAPFAGRLGLTLAPGKQAESSVQDATWARDLERDLDDLVTRFGTDVLVSVMDTEEYARLGVPELLSQAEAKGMTVRHLPVRDVSVPGSELAEPFERLVDAVAGDLHAGRTVVVHCRGGLGRSGLVAACVLVHEDVTAEEAIARVRRDRPGAIETRAQEDYIRTYAAGRPRSA